MALLALCLVAFAACDPDAAWRGPGASPPEVFFPELKKAELTPLVVAKGKFFLGDRGCLRVNDPGAKGDLGFVPLWTPQYELGTGNDGIRILDGRGRVVARVGEKVIMGGGGIDRKTLEEHDFVDERPMRELFERCSGNDHWMVSNWEVRPTSQR